MKLEMLEKRLIEMKKILRDESQLKKPSIHTLERLGKELRKTLEQIDKNGFSIDSNSKIISVHMSLDVFIADLPSELNHDYRNNNKRYKDKWVKQADKIKSIIDRLLSVLEKK